MATLESRVLAVLHPEPLSYMALCNIIPGHQKELPAACIRLQLMGRIKVTLMPDRAVLERTEAEAAG